MSCKINKLSDVPMAYANGFIKVMKGLFGMDGELSTTTEELEENHACMWRYLEIIFFLLLVVI